MVNKYCDFCGGELKYIYDLNGYRIVQCVKCKTCVVEDFPDENTLTKFYSGFNFCVGKENESIIVSPKFNNWLSNFNFSSNSCMLDIGGGGGHFSKLFEKYKYGKATYIDLDNQACEYAKTLGISEVINENVNTLGNDYLNKYDFIYCRHVIEHLVDPTSLIKSAISFLKKGGLFILQFPNGLSYERLIDKEDYRNRTRLLKNSNPCFSKLKIFNILHSNKTAFGLEPVKHLWAISPNGVMTLLNTFTNIEYTYKTYNIFDEIYSPYSTNNDNIYKATCRQLLSSINGKCHSVFFIRKIV